MPEYKVGQPEIFPGQLISQLLFLGGFSTKQYQWISLGSPAAGGLEQTWSRQDQPQTEHSEVNQTLHDQTLSRPVTLSDQLSQ